MKDDPNNDQDAAPQNEEETPAIYSLGRADDGQPTLNRRTFLEIAAAAAGTAVVSNSGCATLPGGKGGGTRGPALAHKESITALAVNASGRLLASGDKGGHLRLWQLPEGTLLHSWSGHESAITDIAFPREDNTLWTLDSSGDLMRWQLPDGESVEDGNSIPGGEAANHTFAVPNAANWYAVGGTGKDVELHNQESGELLDSLSDLDDSVHALEATSDGGFLLVGGTDGNVGLWSLPDATHVRTIETGPSAVSALCIESAVSALSIEQDGTLALSAHADESLRSWRMPELGAEKTYPTTLGKPFSVAIRHQLDLFVAGCEKPEIGLWKLAGSEAGPQLLKGHTATVRATVITPDGSLLISGSDDKTIRLWSLPDGKPLRNLVDLDVNYEHVEGARYEGEDVYGRSITYTLPCGSPIPDGAVCTCNCVPGTLAVPANHLQTYSEGFCTCDLICTCNTVCTCQGVGRGSYVSYWYPN
jgi:WD40 repeat protein